MSYTKTNWINDREPAINADNLNKIEQGIYQAHEDIASKVDKVTGKGLSTNDYTNADKAKVDDISAINKDTNSLVELNSYNLLTSLGNPARTHQGITCVNNGDGSYTLSGTATGDALFNFYNNTTDYPAQIPKGKLLHVEYASTNVVLDLYSYKNGSYLIGWNVKANNSYVIPTDAAGLILRLRVSNGTTVNETVKPVITTAYSNASLEGKKIDRAELYGFSQIDQLANNRKNAYTSQNGITYSLNENGTIKVKGTATAASYFNIITKEEALPDWVVPGQPIKITNSSKIVKASLYFYDANASYITGPDFLGNHAMIVPSNTAHIVIRLMVPKDSTVNENLRISAFVGIEGQRKTITSNEIIVLEDVKNALHLNSLSGSGSVTIGNSNIYAVNPSNKTYNNISFEYDKANGSVNVSSTGATADTTERTDANNVSGSVQCHYAIHVEKDTWLTFNSNPSEWLSFDSLIMYQIYKNGTHIGRDRGLGYSFLAKAGDTYGFRLMVSSGWSGNMTFKPQLNIGKFAYEFEPGTNITYTASSIPNDIPVNSDVVSVITSNLSPVFYWDTKIPTDIQRVKPQPMISFIDDDTTSCTDVRNYHNVFDGTGVKGTYAVMTRRMTDSGTDPDDPSYHYRYDAEGELLALLKQYEMEGFGMVFHCYWQNDAHDNTRYFNVATRDIDKCRINVVRGLREYKEMGFFNDNIWVTPYGVQDIEIQNLAKEVGFECLVSMSNNTVVSDDYRNRWCVPRYSISQTSDNEFLKEQMRTAKEKGGWINIVTHVNSWTSADMSTMTAKVREIINYAQEIGLHIGTFPECFNSWKSAMYDAEV